MGTTLIVRNVEPDLLRRLRLRAAKHNRSVEAEHREILRQVLLNESVEDFKSITARLRAATSGRRHTPAEILTREGRRER